MTTAVSTVSSLCSVLLVWNLSYQMTKQLHFALYFRWQKIFKIHNHLTCEIASGLFWLFPLVDRLVVKKKIKRGRFVRDSVDCTACVESRRQRQHSEHEVLPRTRILVCILSILQHEGLLGAAGVCGVWRAQGRADSGLVQVVGEQHKASQERQSWQHSLWAACRLSDARQSLIFIDYTRVSWFIWKFCTAGWNNTWINRYFVAKLRHQFCMWINDQ